MQLFWVDREIDAHSAITSFCLLEEKLLAADAVQWLAGDPEVCRCGDHLHVPSLPLTFVLGNQAPDRPNTSSFIPQESRNIHTSSNFVKIKLMPGATALRVIYVLSLPFVTVLSDRTAATVPF